MNPSKSTAPLTAPVGYLVVEDALRLMALSQQCLALPAGTAAYQTQLLTRVTELLEASQLIWCIFQGRRPQRIWQTQRRGPVAAKPAALPAVLDEPVSRLLDTMDGRGAGPHNVIKLHDPWSLYWITIHDGHGSYLAARRQPPTAGFALREATILEALARCGLFRAPPVAAEHAPRLSARQQQVLEALCHGLPEKQIAQSLGLTLNTVHSYVTAIYRALQVSGRAELFRKLGAGRRAVPGVPLHADRNVSVTVGSPHLNRW